MMADTAARTDPAASCTKAGHAALFYSGQAEYLEGVMGFLAPALTADEPIAIAVPGVHCQLLAEQIGRESGDLEIFDMRELGRNPARIIPAVHTMIERHAGRQLHYVGEPGWPGRSPEELQEVTRHEALINLAWPGAPIRVLCPYDAAGLADEFLADAEVTHPWLMRSGQMTRSERYGDSQFPPGVDHPLPDPPADALQMSFGVHDLSALRMLVSDFARRSGVASRRTEDLVIAVNEVATNAIKYTPAHGRLRVWSTPRTVVCQLDDRGHIADRLAGRHRPVAGRNGGIGLWMVNQLCDLVETRTTPDGTTIRLHAMRG